MKKLLSSIVVLIFMTVSLSVFPTDVQAARCDITYDTDCWTGSCVSSPRDTSGWTCQIEKGVCCPGTSNCFGDNWNDRSSCEDNYNWCISSAGCPNTALYNGYKCSFYDSSCGAGCLITYYGTKTGKWNADDRACVACNGKIRTSKLADVSGRCWDLTDSTWSSFACSSDYANTCDYGCGAPLDLDNKYTIDSYVKSMSITGTKVSGTCASAKAVSGSTFTISFDYSGSDGSFPYQVKTVELGGPTTNGYISGTCSISSAPVCTWSSYSTSLTAPSTFGPYTYYGKSRSATDSSTSNCGKYDDSKPCTVEVVQCLSDADCGFDSTTKLKMKCRSPGGTGGTPYDYTCTPRPCNSNSECDTGYCCEKVVGGSDQQCRPKGYIYSNNQLCDPPEWSVSSTETTQTNVSVIDLVMNFLLTLFK